MRYFFQILTIVFAAIAGLLFWQRMSLTKDIETLKTEVENCAKRRELSEPMANLLRDTDTRPIILTDGKQYQITIFHNKVRKECALDMSGLPVPSPGKYFQAWAIVEGQDPISLGMVQLNAPAGWQPLPYIENAEKYAISEEASPEGNPTPTFVIASGELGPG